MAGKMRPLFTVTEKVEPKPIITNTSTTAVRSEIDSWVSIYQPDGGEDRFVLISPKNERFSCKFYNPIKKDFVGSSLLAMYELRDHFDRSIIPEKEGF